MLDSLECSLFRRPSIRRPKYLRNGCYVSWAVSRQAVGIKCSVGADTLLSIPTEPRGVVGAMYPGFSRRATRCLVGRALASGIRGAKLLTVRKFGVELAEIALESEFAPNGGLLMSVPGLGLTVGSACTTSGFHMLIVHGFLRDWSKIMEIVGRCERQTLLLDAECKSPHVCSADVEVSVWRSPMLNCQRRGFGKSGSTYAVRNRFECARDSRPPRAESLGPGDPVPDRGDLWSRQRPSAPSQVPINADRVACIH